MTLQQLKPLIQSAQHDVWKNFRCIISDMDDTLTLHGKYTSGVLATLETLQKNGIQVLICTGAAGGWASAAACYLPVAGVIAENGGVFIPGSGNIQFYPLTYIPDLRSHRANLKAVFEKMKKINPSLTETFDNTFRVTEWTFELGSLSVSELQRFEELAEKENLGFTYSTIHCHIGPKNQTKAQGVKNLLKLDIAAQIFPSLTLQQCATIGDSPNDESLFEPGFCGVSVAVKNLEKYAPRLNFLPDFITVGKEGEGFNEFANWTIAQTNRHKNNT